MVFYKKLGPWVLGGLYKDVHCFIVYNILKKLGRVTSHVYDYVGVKVVLISINIFIFLEDFRNLFFILIILKSHSVFKFCTVDL